MDNITKRDKNKISITQFMILLWGGLLSPVMELFLSITSKTASRGAFLAPLVALPVLLLAGYVLQELSGRGKGYMEGIRDSFCTFSGKFVLGIYVLWGVLLLALRLQLCALSFAQVGYKEGSQYFLLPLLVIFVWWMAGSSFSGFARASTLFFGGLLLMFFLVIALSIGDIQLRRTLPFWVEDLPSILEASLGVLGIFGYLIYGSFFLGEVEWSGDENRNGRFWISWSVMGCLLLSLLSFVATGTFGGSLLADMAEPFFQLAKGVRIQGAFQRVEALVASLWTLADFILMGVLLRGTAYASEKILSFDKKRGNTRIIMGSIVVFAGILALFLPKLQQSSDNFILQGNLALGFALPFGLFFVKKVLHFPRKRGTMGLP